MDINNNLINMFRVIASVCEVSSNAFGDFANIGYFKGFPIETEFAGSIKAVAVIELT